VAEIKWIDETEAARILDLSEKRVRQFASAGRIRGRRESNAATGRERTVYHAGDIERLREQRIDRVKSVQTRALATMPGMAPVKAALLGGGENSPAPAADALWVTLDRAAELLGFTVTYTRQLIERGLLPARNLNAFTQPERKAWRVRRSDLEMLAGETLAKARHA